jgi:hypothetical protein
MTMGFWVSWAIVCLIMFALFSDHVLDGMRAIVNVPARATQWVWESLELALTFFHDVFKRQYRPRVYMHRGRHRRSGAHVDKESARWPGADEEYANLLHELNEEHLTSRIAR